MAIKDVKKILHIEYDLNSEEFKSQKLNQVTKKYQRMHPSKLVKVTTYCVQNKQLLTSCTQENKSLIGAGSNILEDISLSNFSLVTLDNEMLNTFELTITASSTIPSYEEAVNIAQAKADALFRKDDTKIPLVTIIDYRFGQPENTVSSSIFGTVDESGNVVTEINGSADITITGGNLAAGILELAKHNLNQGTPPVEELPFYLYPTNNLEMTHNHGENFTYESTINMDTMDKQMALFSNTYMNVSVLWGTQIRFYYEDNTGHNIIGLFNFSTGTDYDIKVVYNVDNNLAQLYIDGNLIAEKTTFDGMKDKFRNTFTIGRQNSTNHIPFKGEIKDNKFTAL